MMHPCLQCRQDLFGGNRVNTHIRDCFPVDEHFPKGLRVQCLYITPTADEIKAGSKGTVLNCNDEHDTTLGRVFQIKDVKFPDDKEVKDFTPKGMSTSMTVLEYFKRFIQPMGETDETLPLVCDDKKHWIPLRMLAIDGPHAYTKCPHLLPTLKETGIALLGLGETTLRKLDDAFFQEFAVTKNTSTDSKVEFLLKAKMITNERGEEVYDSRYLFINEVSHAVL